MLISMREEAAGWMRSRWKSHARFVEYFDLLLLRDPFCIVSTHKKFYSVENLLTTNIKAKK
jgi:hypothetical protein